MIIYFCLDSRTDELVKTFNEWQYILNALILRVLWNFMETGPETKLVLQHGGLKLIIDAYLKTRQDDMYQDYVDEIHENALGCLCGYVVLLLPLIFHCPPHS